MSRCLASSRQHLVEGEGSSGSSRSSSRMVPPPTSQINHWHGCSSISLTDWSAACVTRSGRRMQIQTWNPHIFMCGDTLRTGCMATTRPVTSLGYQEGRSVFWEGPKGFELCPIIFKDVQYNFPGGEKNFQGGALSPATLVTVLATTRRQSPTWRQQ